MKRKPTLYDHYTKRPRPRPDRAGGAYLVEDAGFLTKSQQLRQLALSGEALMEYRKKLHPSYVLDDKRTPEDIPVDTLANADYMDVMDNVYYLQSKLAEERKQRSHLKKDQSNEVPQKTPDVQAQAQALSQTVQSSNDGVAPVS